MILLENALVQLQIADCGLNLEHAYATDANMKAQKAA